MRPCWYWVSTSAPGESQNAGLSRRRIFIIPAPLSSDLRPYCLARPTTDHTIIKTSPVHLIPLARTLRSELRWKGATQNVMPVLVSAACAVYTIKAAPGNANALCPVFAFGRESQRGAGIWPRFLLGQTLGVTWSYSCLCLEVVERTALVWSTCC